MDYKQFSLQNSVYLEFCAKCPSKICIQINTLDTMQMKALKICLNSRTYLKSRIQMILLILKKYMIELAGLPSIYTILRQRRMRWLGHVHRMDNGRIPKDLLLW